MSDDGFQEPLLERLSASPEPEAPAAPPSKRSQKKNKKREATDDDETAADKLSRAPKTKKQKQQYEDENLDMELGINKRFAQMDSQLLADYVDNKTRQFEKELSSVELEDRHISASAITDTTSYDKPHTIDNLPNFLEKFVQNPTKLWGASKKNGTPHTLVITGAGQRAADLARVLKKLQSKDAQVAKLFAKHIKVAEAVEFLKKHRTGMAVGTPKRIEDVMDDGALQVDRLERIVVDASHVDGKKRGVLDMRETLAAVVKLLGRAEFKGRYGAKKGGIEVIFF